MVDIFNGEVKNLSEAIAVCEATFTQAKKNGQEGAAKQADAQRKEVDQELKALLDFKGELASFSQLYGYIAQLINLGGTAVRWIFCIAHTSMTR